MPSIAVVGAQWGDEGKGRVVDVYAEGADIVARFQGGNNAGHTVVVDGVRFALHTVPTGIVRGCLAVVGNGVVVEPKHLLEELDGLQAKGVQVEGKLLLSENAHLIMPYHRALDAASEEALGDRRLGTTRRGIGQAYTDKYARVGIRLGDLCHPPSFRDKLTAILEEKNRLLREFYGHPGFEVEQICQEYLGYAERLRPMVTDTSLVINRALAEGKRVVLEGAQGALLDIDFGTYPYTTSSNPIAGAACTGLGIGPKLIDRVVGVAKAYTTRVGEGPFPTEFDEEAAAGIRQAGGEFGTTTGRPRRIGWFDAVVVRRAVMLSGMDSMAVTHLDVLDRFERIPVCVAYRCQGEEIRDFPNLLARFEQCQPVYQELPGWRQDTSGIRRYQDLPANARLYLEKLVELSGAPVSMVLVGADRAQTIEIEPAAVG